MSRRCVSPRTAASSAFGRMRAYVLTQPPCVSDGNQLSLARTCVRCAGGWVEARREEEGAGVANDDVLLAVAAVAWRGARNMIDEWQEEGRRSLGSLTPPVSSVT